MEENVVFVDRKNDNDDNEKKSNLNDILIYFDVQEKNGLNFGLKAVVGSTHEDFRTSAVMIRLGSVEKKVNVLAPRCCGGYHL